MYRILCVLLGNISMGSLIKRMHVCEKSFRESAHRHCENVDIIG